MNTYAFLLNNTIAEYPVTEEMIKARGHMVSLYALCVYAPKPSIDRFQSLVEKREIVTEKSGERTVYITYSVAKKSFEALLFEVFKGRKMEIKASDVNDDDLINKISSLGDEIIQKQLDAFAASRGYENIAAAISYRHSAVPKWAADAEIANRLRDETWKAVIDRDAKIKASESPLYSNTTEFLSGLPKLTWE